MFMWKIYSFLMVGFLGVSVTKTADGIIDRVPNMIDRNGFVISSNNGKVIGSAVWEEDLQKTLTTLCKLGIYLEEDDQEKDSYKNFCWSIFEKVEHDVAALSFWYLTHSDRRDQYLGLCEIIGKQARWLASEDNPICTITGSRFSTAWHNLLKDYKVTKDMDRESHDDACVPNIDEETN